MRRVQRWLTSLREGRVSFFLTPLFVFAVAMAATVVISFYIASVTESKDRVRFENSVEHALNLLTNRIAAYVDILSGAAAMFEVKPDLNGREFAEFVERLDVQRDYPGIQGIGFAKRMKPEEKTSGTEWVRSEGVTGFHIWPETPEGDSFPIIFLEPRDDRNRAAIGYDMHTEPIRAAAMDRARDTHAPSASGIVTLVQEIYGKKQPGFLIYVPVYRGTGRPANTEDRRALIDGFAYAPFRIHDLMSSIFGSESRPLVDFRVYDGSTKTSATLIYDSNGGEDTYKPLHQSNTFLNVAGRLWAIEFRTRPEFDYGSTRPLVPYIPVAGVLVSLILFLVTRSQEEARARSERALADLRHSQEALRTTEQRANQLLESSIIGIIFAREDGTILEANNAFLQMTGHDREEIGLGQLNWIEMTAPEFRELQARAIAMMNAKGSHPPYEKEILHKDGSRIPVLVGKSLIKIPEKLTVGFIVDLTELQNAREARQRSERLLQTTADSLPALISYIGADQHYRFINRAYEQWFGLAPNEIVGKHMREVLGDAAYEALQPHVERVLSGKQVNCETFVPYKNGARDIALSYVPDFLDGEVIGFAVLISDISDKKREERRQWFFAEASSVLASSLDYETTLNHVAHLAVPDLADWCSVDLLQDDGNIIQLAVAHVGGEMESLAREMSIRFPTSVDQEFGLAKVIRTGEPELISEVDDEVLRELSQGADYLRFIESLGLKSLISVPLFSRGRVLGAVTFVSAESGRVFGPDDLAFAEEVARRAALAIDNALLYAEAQDEIVVRKRAERELTRYAGDLREKAELLELAFDAVIVRDMAARILYWNRGAEELYGYSRAEAIGQKTHDLLRTRFPLPVAHIESQFLEASRWEGELIHTRSDGTEIVTMSRWALQRTPEGEPNTVLEINSNITERKRAEQALKQAHDELEVRVRERTAELAKANQELQLEVAERQRAAEALRRSEAQLQKSRDFYLILFEDFPAMVWRAGTSGKRDYFNRTWLRFAGKKMENELDGHWMDSLHPEDRAMVGETFAEAFASHAAYGVEYRLRRSDGEYRWIFEAGNPFNELSGEFGGYVGSCYDVTIRKQAEEEIRQFNEQLERRVQERTAELEQAIKELEAFSYSVSHDLRAPLRSVDSYSRILEEELREKLSDDAQRYLQLVRRNAQQMGQLIEDLLTFSRLSRQPVTRRTIDTARLVRDTFDDLQSDVGNRKVDLRVQDVPPSYADPRLLKQVYANLLSNAIKYTRLREQAIIEIGSEKIDGETAFFVRDNGVGFRMKHADKLFGVFQRLHRSDEYEGTGVGLAIVQRIVDRHHGRVWARADEDKGATFYFTLGDASDG